MQKKNLKNKKKILETYEYPWAAPGCALPPHSAAAQPRRPVTNKKILKSDEKNIYF